MTKSEVRFIPHNKAAIIPKTLSDGAAGYDLYSISSGVVSAHSILPLKLGFSLNLPRHLFGYICGRSGLGKNYGINVINSYVKDENEVEIYLKNTSSTDFVFEKGMRIAQLFFAIIDNCKIDEVTKEIN